MQLLHEVQMEWDQGIKDRDAARDDSLLMTMVDGGIKSEREERGAVPVIGNAMHGDDLIRFFWRLPALLGWSLCLIASAGRTVHHAPTVAAAALHAAPASVKTCPCKRAFFPRRATTCR